MNRLQNPDITYVDKSTCVKCGVPNCQCFDVDNNITDNSHDARFKAQWVQALLRANKMCITEDISGSHHCILG